MGGGRGSDISGGLGSLGRSDRGLGCGFDCWLGGRCWSGNGGTLEFLSWGLSAVYTIFSGVSPPGIGLIRSDVGDVLSFTNIVE